MIARIIRASKSPAQTKPDKTGPGVQRTRPKERYRGRRGILVLLAGMLAFSAAIRVGLGVEAARALSPPDLDLAEAGGPDARQVCDAPDLLVTAMMLREDRLEAREFALEDRLVALSLAETTIAEQMAALVAAEEELASTLALANGAAEADLARLTAVYETMKPKDAAQLFQAMAPEFAAGFLGRMRADAAAAILSGMTSEAAYGVSLLLAGRNARVPKE